MLTYLTHEKYGISEDRHKCEVIIFLTKSVKVVSESSPGTGRCKTNFCKAQGSSSSCVETLPIAE